MIGVLVALMFAWVPIVAHADEASSLPNFNADAICSDPHNLFGMGDIASSAKTAEEQTAIPSVMESLKMECIKLQGQMKSGLEAEHLSARVLTYCIADAEFHGDGYLGMAKCLDRVRHEEQVARAAKAFGFDVFKTCSAPASGGACLEREDYAYRRFLTRGAIDDGALFERCLGETVASGKGYFDLGSCLNVSSSRSALTASKPHP